MGTYSITYTYESVTLSISGFSIGDTIRIFCRTNYYGGGANETTILDISFETTRSSYEYVIALEAETPYAVNVGTKVDINTTWWETKTFTTPAKPSVAKWDWTISNGSATAAQTQAAYTAITSKGETTNFSYLVWNDLVNKCYEVITDRNGSWVTGTITLWGVSYGECLSYADTLMSSNDRVMTADRFNAVWWQCAQYITAGMSAYCPTSPGDTIKGSYFIDLANAVNNTIWTG